MLQTAVLHVQSAGRQEVQSGDVLAATLQQNKSYAAQLLAAQGVTRLDVLEYITHGISKVPPAAPRGDEEPGGDAEAGAGEAGTATSRDPLSAYAMNLTTRARAGELDPLIGRLTELQRTMEILCRRRKNNPVFVGDAGVGKTALAEGLATRLLSDDVPELLEGAEVFSLDTGALLAGTQVPRRLRRTVQGGHRTRSRSARCRSCSSTRSTRRSAPAPPPAARWISRP